MCQCLLAWSKVVGREGGMCAITVIMDLILMLNRTRVLHDRLGMC